MSDSPDFSLAPSKLFLQVQEGGAVDFGTGPWPRAIYIGVSGTLRLRGWDDVECTFTNVLAGNRYPFAAKEIISCPPWTTLLF